MLVKAPDTRQLTWNGCGQAISKTISCAEIMKRQFKVCGDVLQHCSLMYLLGNAVWFLSKQKVVVFQN